MAQAPAEQGGDGSRVSSVCYWHPDVETGLSCSRCEKRICSQCLVQAPVGIRCRECGKAQPMPTYDVRPSNYLLALGVALVIQVAGTVAWVFIDQFLFALGAYGSVSGLVAVAFGFITGELISRSVNRKRSTLLGLVACAVVILAYLISRPINPFGFGIFQVLFVGMGVYLAWQRLRP